MLILLGTIHTFFVVYMLMLIVRILGSWLPELQGTRFMLFIAYYTDPYLNLFRQLIPPLGMLDISPIVAFFCLQLLEAGIKSMLLSLMT